MQLAPDTLTEDVLTFLSVRNAAMSMLPDIALFSKSSVSVVMDGALPLRSFMTSYQRRADSNFCSSGCMENWTWCPALMRPGSQAEDAPVKMPSPYPVPVSTTKSDAILNGCPCTTTLSSVMDAPPE